MARWQLEDAVAEPDPLRALARRAQEHLGRGHVRVLLEEVVLDDPGVVVNGLGGQLDLREHVGKQPMLALRRPRPGQLRLVEDAEFHRGPVTPSVRTSTERPPSSFSTKPERGRTVRASRSYSTRSPFSRVT